jgi:hypothetical protein
LIGYAFGSFIRDKLSHLSDLLPKKDKQIVQTQYSDKGPLLVDNRKPPKDYISSTLPPALRDIILQSFFVDKFHDSSSVLNRKRGRGYYFASRRCLWQLTQLMAT